MVFVKDKHETLILYMDYRGFNKITIKNRYLLPKIDDLFDQLKEVGTFFKIDIQSSYH